MWVEGVVRVVCGLSLTTSCQDVVIALAKSLGESLRFHPSSLSNPQAADYQYNICIYVYTLCTAASIR